MNPAAWKTGKTEWNSGLHWTAAASKKGKIGNKKTVIEEKYSV